MAIMSSLTGGDYYDYQVKNGQGYEIELSIKDNNVQLEKLTPIAMEEAEEKDKMTITLHMTGICQRFFA